MATSSSSADSCLNQREFYCDSSDSCSPNTRKCPLCCKFRKRFYCKDCIQTGAFSKTNSKPIDSYVDLQKELLELEDRKRGLERNSMKLLSERRKDDVLRSKIRQSRDRNIILKLAIEEKKRIRLENAERLSSLSEKNQRDSELLEKFRPKAASFESLVEAKRYKLAQKRQAFVSKQEEVKRIARLRIQQLFKYIFPITKIKPLPESESSESDEMVNALAEASQTYSTEGWEYGTYSNELNYCIVGPTLPGSGNYWMYNILIAQNQEAATNVISSVEHNPAFSIGAGLTYTAQLLNILAFYLDVKLPYKLSYSDFCSPDLTDQKFNQRVARLNANVLYLCFYEHVDLNLLRPNETIRNILQLIEDEKADLGRQGPFEVDYQLAAALEQPLISSLKLCEDSDSEEGDSLPVEWEAVPHVHCPEIQPGPATAQSTQMITTQQASSVAGGLVNSAAASLASIWRGFTRR